MEGSRLFGLRGVSGWHKAWLGAAPDQQIQT
eukprot:CAMPEP_0118943402 /NCGR_PEP_ID=MMETSP1169-20130426/38235_1 /TAXON_ID=36882 /ORGANISM="Pyramimonas obovata, Strain CCMP722" /LENGTH=30 /DNA_ID= /DNA_START= /DNA_END= /DNA_ORIENTATION=